MSQDEELVKFTVLRTSDAARKEVSISTASTKLMDLKRILAKDECFGPDEAPVTRQRIFHLGREFKSGGRSLCNLGLGRFNNRIIHLCIRPALDERGQENRLAGQQQGSAASVRARKRLRTEGDCGREEEEDNTMPLPFSASLSASSLQLPPFMQQNIDNQHEDRINHNAINNNNTHNTSSISMMGQAAVAAAASFNTNTNTNNHSTANSNSAIDLLDSSHDEDDEVEVIEIL
uniref:Ubiquitin-like domain-containing protein n=1 Tax=Pseudo-nitzschia australis TaxID=44445 RepID=A0A7S4AD58_9STRA|mmetsp:Transcript_19191/g.41704  ORF Transcript_19191/g.41704 Transcript_19191/m.41704 type:complete len:233 (+) Transcript_19191:189-887(+)